MDMAKLIEAIKAHSGLDDGQIIQAGEHGADAGWPGFTYTHDCCEFFDRHAADIWELLAEMAQDLGAKNPAELVAGFRRADMIEDWDTFRTLLAWFALEEAGRWLACQVEEGQP